METNKALLEQLKTDLKKIAEYQQKANSQIYDLKSRIADLEQKITQELSNANVAEEKGVIQNQVKHNVFLHAPVTEAPKSLAPKKQAPKTGQKMKVNRDLEKFIGENLINKIGIGITVIGVGIGVKYSIEHNLISPFARIILAYVFAIGLLLFGMKLKGKYPQYSAVLVSGAMASMYFITYAAFEFYNIFGLNVAFLLMLFFTVFTVIAALSYNSQVIAIIGLVGAYAIPILLSTSSGRAEILFGYMAIINMGIMVIAIKKDWKILLQVSFWLTWMIFIVWYFRNSHTIFYKNVAAVFSTLFFFIFYAAITANKLRLQQKIGFSAILLLLINAFIFYGLGYALISSLKNGENHLGLFTLANAAIHFAVGTVVFKRKLVDVEFLYIILALAISFVTLAIPVQLDGNWVTLFWAFEALFLFWLGSKKSLIYYQNIAYILFAISTFSLLQDMGIFYGVELVKNRTPFFNIQALSSLLVIASFSAAAFIDKKHNINSFKGYFVFATMALGLLFGSMLAEINLYWEIKLVSSKININTAGYASTLVNPAIKSFKNLAFINASIFFFAILGAVNSYKFKSETAANVLLVIKIILVFLFLILGQYEISELREIYLRPAKELYFSTHWFYIGIRYFSLACFAALIWFTLKKENLKLLQIAANKNRAELVLYAIVIWVLSSELLHWMDFAALRNSYKLALSILWGILALGMVVVGIFKNKQHLRIAAMALFAFTLLKLFIYDISHLSTIHKTLIFIILGVILLLISFLYNKYKTAIANEEN